MTESLVQGWNQLADTIHAEVRVNGFYDAYDQLFSTLDEPEEREQLKLMSVGQKLALVTSEVGELVEAFRKPRISKKLLTHTEAEEEMADVVIRLLDLAAFLGMDIEGAMQAKLAYNRTRTYMHGGKSF